MTAIRDAYDAYDYGPTVGYSAPSGAPHSLLPPGADPGAHPQTSPNSLAAMEHAAEQLKAVDYKQYSAMSSLGSLAVKKSPLPFTVA